MTKAMTLLKRCFWIVGIGLAAILAIRLIWVASHTPHSSHYLWLQWRPATLDWLVQREIPLAARMPKDQAEFWLAEVDRVVGKTPTDARLAIGAALVIEEPETDFWQPYSAQFYRPVRDANQPFDAALADRDWRLIEQAIALDPDNPDWRRFQALSLIRHGSFWFADSPPLARRDDWRKILDECARRDPNNALYHYVATILYWDASFENWAISGDRKILDQSSYDLGLQEFEQGLALPLETGENAYREAKVEFLDQAAISPSDRQRIYASGRERQRLRFLYRSLFDRHDVPKYPLLSTVAAPNTSLTPAEQKAQLVRNAQTSLKNLRRDMQLREQWSGSSGEMDEMKMPRSEVEDSIYRLLMIGAQKPNPFTPGEIAELKDLYQAEVRRNAIIKQFQLNRSPPAPGSQTANVNRRLAADALAMALPPLLLVAVCGYLLSRICSWTLPQVGPIVSTLCLLLAGTVVFVIFGLGTARLIHYVLLSRAATASLFVLAALAILIGCLQYVRNYGAPLTRIQFLLALFAAGIALRFIVPATVNINDLMQWASHWAAPDRHAIFDAWLLRLDRYGQWEEAQAQWLSYGGPALTVFVWAILLGGAVWMKTWFRRSEEWAKSGSRLGQSWARRGAELALVATICYLLITPKMLAIFPAEEQYQRQAAVFPAALMQMQVEAILDDPIQKLGVDQTVTSSLEAMKSQRKMVSGQAPL